MSSSTENYSYSAGRQSMTGVQRLGPLLALGLLAALSPRLSPLVRTAASLGLISVTMYIMLSYTTGSATTDRRTSQSELGAALISTILFMGLSNPMHDFHYVRDPDTSPLASRALYIRFWNMLCLICNNRLIGWNVQVSNVPEPFVGTRAQFFFHCLRKLLWSYFILDTTEGFMYLNRDMFPSTGSSTRFWTAYPAEPAGTISMVVVSFHLHAAMQMYYTFFSLVVLLLGIGEVEDWPNLFGDWADAYTVRRFWGRVWHQMLRRHISRYNDFVIKVLHIRRGTILSSQLQLHLGFLFSALYHSLGDLAMSPSSFGRSGIFFIANGLAVTLEDALLGIARKVGFAKNDAPSTILKLLGYTWVIMWFRLSLPIHVNWLFESGGLQLPLLPFSMTRSYLLPALRALYPNV